MTEMARPTRRKRITPFELLEQLVPVESLDEEGLQLYRALAASGDEETVRAGVGELLERLCRLGRLRRLSRTHSEGNVQAKYYDPVSLHTIAITFPGPPKTEPPTEVVEPAARDLGGRQVPLPLPLLEAVAASSRRIDLAGAIDHLHDILRETAACDRSALFMSTGLSTSFAGRPSELEDVFRWSEEELVIPGHLKAEIEASGRTLVIEDLAIDARSAVPTGKRSHGSLIAAPLRAEGYVYGILEVWCSRPRAFSPDHVAVVEFIAEFAGGLIKRRLEIEELIFVDQTSQIHNRRYFDEQLVREIERCKRTGHAMALLIADIDDFKRVNDTMGHAAGDSVLRQVAKILSENARQLDIVARYGGEEFGVILPNVTRETAQAVAERIRSTVAHHRFMTGSPVQRTCELTISIGGALYPLDAESRAELIDRADRIALYEAKRRGKNRVIFWKDVEIG